MSLAQKMKSAGYGHMTGVSEYEIFKDSDNLMFALSGPLSGARSLINGPG